MDWPVDVRTEDDLAAKAADVPPDREPCLW